MSTYMTTNVQGGHFVCSSNSYLSSSPQWASGAPAPNGCYYSHGSGIKINNNVVTEAITSGQSTGPYEITGNTVDRIAISAGNSDNNLWGIGGHTISNNTFVPGSGDGLYIFGNHGNTISDNTFQGKNIGIRLVGSQNNIITNNNFILNGDDVLLIKTQNSYPNPQPPTASSGNTFSQNYWDSFDSAGETCYNDSPFDKYCDATYSVPGIMTTYPYSVGSPGTIYNNAPLLSYQDSQPWVMQDGAMPSSPIIGPDTTGPDDPVPTVTASAYLNSTSSTGRTINVTGANIPADNATSAALATAKGFPLSKDSSSANSSPYLRIASPIFQTIFPLSEIYLDNN